MATSLQSPKILANTFCNDGDKTSTIPVTATGTNACSLEEGFPAITSTAVSGGGIPPKRLDFNGVFNLLSQYCYFLQNGGTFEYSASVSTAIGGYPEGAILYYTDSSDNTFKIQSLIDNNTNEPSASNIQFENSGTGTYYWKAISLRPTNERTVINTYKSGNNWYRLYSDGWVEQGGTTYSVSQGNRIYVTYPVAMQDTSYCLTLSAGFGTGSGGTNTVIEALSVTGCTIWSGSPSYYKYYVCGYKKA